MNAIGFLFMLFAVTLSTLFFYFIMMITTLSLWWYCFGERHPNIDYVDSIDQMFETISFPESSWQRTCGFLWPIFLFPLLIISIFRLLGWKMVRDGE